jgi:hypothetical protein
MLSFLDKYLFVKLRNFPNPVTLKACHHRQKGGGGRGCVTSVCCMLCAHSNEKRRNVDPANLSDQKAALKRFLEHRNVHFRAFKFAENFRQFYAGRTLESSRHFLTRQYIIYNFQEMAFKFIYDRLLRLTTQMHSVCVRARLIHSEWIETIEILILELEYVQMFSHSFGENTPCIKSVDPYP